MRLIARRSRDRLRNMELLIGVIIISLVTLLCAIVPLVNPYGSNAIAGLPFQSPSLSHPFGMDELGRDVFVRVFAGGRLDFIIALVVIAPSLLVGTLIGTASG